MNEEKIVNEENFLDLRFADENLCFVLTVAERKILLTKQTK